MVVAPFQFLNTIIQTLNLIVNDKKVVLNVIQLLAIDEDAVSQFQMRMETKTL